MTYTGRNHMASADLHRGAFNACTGRIILRGMAGRTYLREWRKKIGLTQDEVVARLDAMDDPLLPKTGASLSRLENGKQPYSERVIEALAFIYGREPWELIGRNPEKEGQVVDMFQVKFDALNDAQKAQALAILDALKAAG